jgi:hypothetical protein
MTVCMVDEGLRMVYIDVVLAVSFVCVMLLILKRPPKG